MSIPSRKPPRSVADTVVYLYGITLPAKADSRDAVSAVGIDGSSPIVSDEVAGLVCWFSRVSRRDFADKLAENMENLDWLSVAGVRHQKAVSEISRRTTILPARFGTIFLTLESLEQDIKRRKPALLRDLKRFQDSDEWGIKVFALPQARPAIIASSGADYLRQKAAQRASKAGEHAVSADVKKFAAAAKKISAASVETAGSISGVRPDLEWQASFLIRRSKQKQLQTLLKRFSDAWEGKRRIECTGPWPPYSFVGKS
ncbi:MAG: GvpL/GvpF family gas vesicle protein [Terriglobales bacterium]